MKNMKRLQFAAIVYDVTPLNTAILSADISEIARITGYLISTGHQG